MHKAQVTELSRLWLPHEQLLLTLYLLQIALVLWVAHLTNYFIFIDYFVIFSVSLSILSIWRRHTWCLWQV